MIRFCLLLIGSITCAAQKPGNNQTNMNSNQAHMASSQHGTSSTGGSDSRSTHGTQQGAPGDSSPYQFAEESWSSSTGTGGEDEPVFTPVDDEDQVYAYKSKSRYNQPVVLQPPVFPHPEKHPNHPGPKGY
uniref:Uncharacterized protein n=1 Tax=Xiphophorus couchianus TaxID=32473 RepID=A0A3B5LCE3_9TELE